MSNSLLRGKVCYWDWQKPTLLHGVKRLWNEELVLKAVRDAAHSSFKAEVLVYQEAYNSMLRDRELRSVIWSNMSVVDQKDIEPEDGDQLGLL